MSDVIKTERLLLRSLRDADGEVVIAAFNTPAIVMWLSSPPYPFKAKDLKLQNKDGTTLWPDCAAIELDGKMIGMIGGQPHLGYWLLPQFWGKGYATEAGMAIVAAVFNSSQAQSIASGYFEGNESSAKVLAKLGFSKIGGGIKFCRPRGEDVPFVEMMLDRSQWIAIK